MPFITFEGADGSGKTTHINLLANYFEQQKRPILVTREPGGTKLGNTIRNLVLSGAENNITAMAEMLLIAAARAEHVEKVLRPALEADKVILCDRYIDSSLVYQGIGLNLGLDLVAKINDIIVGGLWPDLTIILDVTPEEAYQRSIVARRQADRIESRGLDYYRQVCKGYRSLAHKWPERIRLVDSSRPQGLVHQDIVEIIKCKLNEGG